MESGYDHDSVSVKGTKGVSIKAILPWALQRYVQNYRQRVIKGVQKEVRVMGAKISREEALKKARVIIHPPEKGVYKIESSSRVAIGYFFLALEKHKQGKLIVGSTSIQNEKIQALKDLAREHLLNVLINETEFEKLPVF
ncbi:MAG: hypothetical protein ACFFG0_11510 [Candidatus Thorarchaeota archaeon]